MTHEEENLEATGHEHVHRELLVARAFRHLGLGLWLRLRFTASAF